ncbi:MaoC family dehydratase N-terminal domain-containing protein [Acidovorax sp. Leaf160]|uniref:FAS1-like dehydratase domain-containing protein n=1 Tax=Acidovorax sp. Leaf160 TaxID=1736280 RepID=UPI0006F20210|nr:MaoC family dehydratase N-terminal domain-containing protein [Acidovorax sp. Leaf160]KQR55564.1 acyl-CoA dehydrogenase [Acidovorax sp. Leaf160]
MTTAFANAEASAPRPLDAAQLAHLQSWQGRSESTDDVIAAAPVRGLAATLDRDDPAPHDGTVLPPLWHWAYFLPHARQGAIGPDGHPLRGGFLPPVPLPRRMWAGGRLRWAAGNPLRVGDAARRDSRIVSVSHKAGRSGDLLFVQVEHTYSNAHGMALVEEHDIVYRAAAQPGDPAPAAVAAEQGAAWQREIVPDDVLLFRYSALTFNGHRIHYDRRYVTQVEGYSGLVVHGPLIATLLLDLLRRQRPGGAAVAAFAFKAVRPTFDLHPFRLNGQPSADGRTVRLWAQDHEGWLTMEGTATLAA